MSTPKGPPKIKELDFTGFHPLDHTVWACRGYPGGRRTHLAYRWDFQWRDKLRKWFLCPVNRHIPVTWWGQGRTGISCQACGKDFPEMEN